MTFYVAKHKFFGSGILTPGKSKKLGGPVQLNLLKHFDNEYRVPNIDGIPTFQHKYVHKNRSSLRGDFTYNLIIPSLDSYRDNKKIIVYLIGLSYDFTLNHWNARLKFYCPRDSDGQRKYNVRPQHNLRIPIV